MGVFIFDFLKTFILMVLVCVWI